MSTKTLSGALMVEASFKGTNMTEVVMSKAYALDADFTGANFTNSVVDRVTFDNANLTNANFYNAVITGTTYEVGLALFITLLLCVKTHSLDDSQASMVLVM